MSQMALIAERVCEVSFLVGSFYIIQARKEVTDQIENVR